MKINLKTKALRPKPVKDIKDYVGTVIKSRTKSCLSVISSLFLALRLKIYSKMGRHVTSDKLACTHQWLPECFTDEKKFAPIISLLS
jgi:hypothetical protein